MIRILLIILLSGIASGAFSQLKIVKDNIACTYGLKDGQGKWVVPATYILVEEMPGFYKVTTDEGRGILTGDGKMLVKPQYDAIELLNTGFFRVSVKSKYGLLNTRGQAICEPLYSTVLHDPNGCIMLYKYDNHSYRTSCIDTTGKVLIPEVEGYISPFGTYSFALIGQYPGHDNSISGNAGVIDRSGKLQVPREYEFLKYCDSRFIFRKNYKTGVVDLNNNILLEPKYTVFTHDGSTPCFRENDVLRIMDGTKIGFMRGNGEIMIEPMIDELILLYPDQQTAQATWLFRRGNKMGVISKDYKITVDALYDTLIPRARITWNEPYSGKASRLMFQFSENGKYGLMKDDGSIVCQAEYDNFLRSDYAKKPGYFFSKGLDIFFLDFNAGNIVPEKAKLLARYDSLLVFESREELLPCFTRSKSNRISSMGSEHFEYRTYGNIFAVATRKGYRYFTTDGKVFLKNKALYIDFHQGKYYLVNTQTAKRGLYHPGLQKMIVDTLYDNINAANAHKNMIWVMLPYKAKQNDPVLVNPMSQTLARPMYEWIILDTNGRRTSREVFDAVVHTTDTTFAYSKGLTGIVDHNMHWLIPPEYQKVAQISKNYFAVSTPGGKYGAVNLRNKPVVDTVFTGFREIFIGVYSDWKRSYPTQKAEAFQEQRWYLFWNDKLQVLFNEAGESLSSHRPSEARQIEKMLVDFAFRGAGNSGSNALRIQVLPHQGSLLARVAFREQLYNLVKSYYDTLSLCNPLEMTPNPYFQVPVTCYNAFNRHFALKSLGNKYVTLESKGAPRNRNHWPETMDYSPETYRYENRIWKQDKLEKLELKMLFPNTEVLEGELIRTLQERDDLKLNCTSPANMLELIGENFSLSKQGLILYYQEGYTQVEFLVSTERLSQNAHAKWIVDYLD